MSEKRYKLLLETEVVCPEQAGKPELTITLDEVRQNLLKTQTEGRGWAVAGNGGDKLTAWMTVQGVTAQDDATPEAQDRDQRIKDSQHQYAKISRAMQLLLEQAGHDGPTCGLVGFTNSLGPAGNLVRCACGPVELWQHDLVDLAEIRKGVKPPAGMAGPRPGACTFTELVDRQLAMIRRHKEAFVEAWVAETGLLPSESTMLQQETEHGVTITIVRRQPIANQAVQLNGRQVQPTTPLESELMNRLVQVEAELALHKTQES